MFVSGMNRFHRWSFSLLASSLGLPAADPLDQFAGHAVERASSADTSMLFAMGFIHSSWAGGVSGISSHATISPPRPSADRIHHRTFHLSWASRHVRILGALFFWFPKLFGRRLKESARQLTSGSLSGGLISSSCPLHWLGLLTHANLLLPAAASPRLLR